MADNSVTVNVNLNLNGAGAQSGLKQVADQARAAQASFSGLSKDDQQRFAKLINAGKGGLPDQKLLDYLLQNAIAQGHFTPRQESVEMLPARGVGIRQYGRGQMGPFLPGISPMMQALSGLTPSGMNPAAMALLAQSSAVAPPTAKQIPTLLEMVRKKQLDYTIDAADRADYAKTVRYNLGTPQGRAQEIAGIQTRYGANADQFAAQRAQVGIERGQVGSPEHLRALREQLALQREQAQMAKETQRAERMAGFGPGPWKQFGEGAKEFTGQLRTLGSLFPWVSGGMTGLVAAAGPAPFQTLTGSIQLLSGSLGRLLIPVVVEVSSLLQRGSDWIDSWDAGTRKTVGTVAAWTLGLTAGAFVLTRVIGFVGTLSPLAFGLIAALGRLAIAQAAVAQTGTAMNASLVGTAAATKTATVGANAATAGGLLGRLGGAGGLAAGAGRLLGVGAAGFGGGMAAEAMGLSKGGISGTIGTVVGTILGGVLGSFVPVPGATFVGAGLGGALGSMAGSWLGEKLSPDERSRPAISTGNYQPRIGQVEQLGLELIQSTLRDDLQQKQFQQQMEALRELQQSANEIARNTRRND